MKKGILPVLFIMFLLPSVFAYININDFEKVLYNNGDNLIISGYITRDSSVSASLDFILGCNNNSFHLPTLLVDIESSKPREFETSTIIPSLSKATCTVKLKLYSDSSLLEEKESSSFEVTPKIDGSFQLVPLQVQIGRVMTLSGNLFKHSGTNINGNAEIYFRNEAGSKYYIGTSTITNGLLDYSYTAPQSTPGRYYIDLVVNDVFGNRQSFDNVASFNLVDELALFAKTSKINVLPGEKISLFGEVKTVLQEKIDKAVLTLDFNNMTYTFDVRDSRFSSDLTIPLNIKSGKHVLHISAKDTFGNWGKTFLHLYVEAVPSRLELEILNTSLIPESALEVIPLSYDQAGDSFIDNVDLAVLNPDDIKVYSTIVENGDKIIYPLPMFSQPGIWKVSAISNKLTAEKKFEVMPLVDLNIKLVNTTLYIWNRGNVEYDKPVEINFNNGEIIFTKKISLDPNKTMTIDLVKEAPTGQYDIAISGSAISDVQFDDIVIVSKDKKSLTIPYFILITLLLTMFVYLFLYKKKKFVTKRVLEERTARKAKQKLERLRSAKKSKPAPRNVFTKEKSISDFRKRVMEDIKKTEDNIERQKRQERLNRISDSSEPSAKPKEETKNLFALFK